MVDGHDSKSCGFTAVRVQVPLRPLVNNKARVLSAYIIGVALGDGNLSNPNGRVTRLRVTCDAKYPNIATEIIEALKFLFPKNKVSIVAGPKNTYFNISLYSKKLDSLIPWKVGGGSKIVQSVRVPVWILENPEYTKVALKGLIQTDGSIYTDRGYLMLNFTSVIKDLADDVFSMFTLLDFHPKISKTIQKTGNIKYTVRLARNVKAFVQLVGIEKS